MRRRTVEAALDKIAEFIPSDEELIRGTMAAAQEDIELNLKQLAEQQRLAAEAEAKKPGGWRARTFAKTVDTWQDRTDHAIDAYNELAAKHGLAAWGEASAASDT